MKKLLAIALLASTTFTYNQVNAFTTTQTEIAVGEKIDVKLKNDSGDEVTVYNAGSGGSYRLQKNVVTTIKMEPGDKLYVYNGGKKGALLLTASSDMDGKVQLYSKL
jgi:hypothetical protein